MKPFTKLISPVFLVKTAMLLSVTIAISTVSAQTTQNAYWFRRAYGQVFYHDIHGDYFWPDNNYWQQAPHYGQYGGQTLEDQPGNWSDSSGNELGVFPDGDYNVFISNAGVFAGDNHTEVAAGFGYNPVTVTSLVVQNTGLLQLNPRGGSLTVTAGATVQAGATLHLYDGSAFTSDSLTLESGASFFMDGSGAMATRCSHSTPLLHRRMAW